MIICVMGLPGSGKTTTANILENELSKFHKVHRISTDDIGLQLFMDKYYYFNDRDFDYSKTELSAIYNSVRFLSLISNPKDTLIIDGSFREVSQRLALKIFAKESGHEVTFLEIISDTKTNKKRVDKRLEQGGHGGVIKNYEQPRYENVIQLRNESTVDDLRGQLIEIFTLLYYQAKI